VVSVSGDGSVKRSLEELGFVPGAAVTVLRRLGGDVIVRLAQARVAIGRDSARHVVTCGAPASSRGSDQLPDAVRSRPAPAARERLFAAAAPDLAGGRP
jgi:ferrous iron transport protein A